MICEPPGDPVTISGFPCLSRTIVGAIELRGRLPPATPLAIALPFASTGTNEKSVSSLLRRKPAAHKWEPNALSIDAVIDTALPSSSTIEICVVPGTSCVASFPNAFLASPGGSPGSGFAIALAGSISRRRSAR